jgi:hypothetical protein
MLTDKEQSERFTGTARELGMDESGESFEKAMNAILGDNDKNNSRQIT